MEEAANSDLLGVGDRIRQARLEAGLTQDELSDLIGVGMRQIQYYEAGDSNPYRTLRRIGEATGKSLTWLLHGDPVTSAGDATQTLELLDRRLVELAGVVVELGRVQAETLAEVRALREAREAERAQPRARPRRKPA